jgi:predicted transcriptional regulator/DNA-binding XRE family transcriptional regulator
MPRRKIAAEAALSPSHSNSDYLENFADQLQRVRCDLGITQCNLAERLGVGQTALSHMEKRNDLLLSTLSAYINALGGKLQVAATFENLEPIVLAGDASWRPSPTLHKEIQDGTQLCLPGVLPSKPISGRDVIFSIRPNHAEKILAGTKTVELRRRFTADVRPGTLALIYTTSPTRALTGFAKISGVQKLAVPDLWQQHRVAACLKKGDFEAYFSGLDRGYAIMLSSARPLSRPVGLPELRERFGFAPPQSYQYASAKLRGFFDHEQSKTPN